MCRLYKFPAETKRRKNYKNKINIRKFSQLQCKVYWVRNLQKQQHKSLLLTNVIYAKNNELQQQQNLKYIYTRKDIQNKYCK